MGGVVRAIEEGAFARYQTGTAALRRQAIIGFCAREPGSSVALPNSAENGKLRVNKAGI